MAESLTRQESIRRLCELIAEEMRLAEAALNAHQPERADNHYLAVDVLVLHRRRLEDEQGRAA